MSNTILRVKTSIKSLCTSALFLFFCHPDSYGQFCNQSVTSESIAISTSEQQTTTTYSSGRRAFTFDASEGNTDTFETFNTTSGGSELMTCDHDLTIFINVAVFIEWYYNCEADNKRTC